MASALLLQEQHGHVGITTTHLIPSTVATTVTTAAMLLHLLLLLLKLLLLVEIHHQGCLLNLVQ
jgi:hypothetical protein